MQNKLSSNPNGKRVTDDMIKEREHLKHLLEYLKRVPVNEKENLDDY